MQSGVAAMMVRLNSSLARRASSARLRSVTSVAVPWYPWNAPEASNRGSPLRRIQWVCPSKTMDISSLRNRWWSWMVWNRRA